MSPRSRRPPTRRSFSTTITWLSSRGTCEGVDRLDYTKGIPERIAAIDRLLEARLDLRDRFLFVQIGVPSREEVPAYIEIGAEIDEQIARVNTRYGRGPDDGPIRYLKKPFE